MAMFVKVSDRLINLDTVTMIHVQCDADDCDQPTKATVDHIGGGHCHVSGADDVAALLDACGVVSGKKKHYDRDI